MVKKVVEPCLDVIIIAFFPRNIQWSSLFAQKACVKTEQVPPGHPIILLKSNKFNMATISVKRAIVMLCAIVCIVVGQWTWRVFYYYFLLVHIQGCLKVCGYMPLAAWSRIEQLRISFGSVFLLFPMKVAKGSRSCGQGIFSPEIKTVKWLWSVFSSWQ